MPMAHLTKAIGAWLRTTCACGQPAPGAVDRDIARLMEFKSRWGVIKAPPTYYYYPHLAGLAATSESSWKSRLLTTCWKRLPLQVAGPLGGYLYKHLG